MIDNPAAMNNSSIFSVQPFLSCQYDFGRPWDPPILGMLGDLLSARESSDESFFWFRRAGKGLTELRIHFHGAEDEAPLWRGRLAAGIGRLGGEGEPESIGYSPTPEVFGGPPFTEDEDYLVLATRMLGAGCEWILSRRDGAGRDLFFARLVAHGAASLGMTEEEWVAFLVYYRNWLIRWPLMMKKASQAAADPWTAKLAQRARTADGEAAGEAGLAAFRQAWVGDYEDGAESTPSVAWDQACTAVGRYLRAQETRPGYRVDPFSENLMSPPICKLVLSLSNALGYTTTEQAVLLQALLQAAGPSRASEIIPLRPSTDG